MTTVAAQYTSMAVVLRCRTESAETCLRPKSWVMLSQPLLNARKRVARATHFWK